MSGARATACATRASWRRPRGQGSACCQCPLPSRSGAGFDYHPQRFVQVLLSSVPNIGGLQNRPPPCSLSLRTFSANEVVRMRE